MNTDYADPSYYAVIVLIWIGVLLAAIPYVRAARHPEARPVVAYVSFATVLTLGAYAFFAALVALSSLARGQWLPGVGPALLLFALSLPPAFWRAMAIV